MLIRRATNPRRAGYRIAVAISALLAMPAPAAGSQNLGARLEGLRLVEAMELLRTEADLNIIYSEGLVSPELRVAVAPESQVPETMLREILGPHSLTTRSGPGGRWVVERALGGTIVGVVRELSQGLPLARALVRTDAVAEGVLTEADGSFRLEEVPPGLCSLEVSADGYRSARVEAVQVAIGKPAEIEVALDLSIIAIDAIVVTPSRVAVSQQDPSAPLGITAEEVRQLPDVTSDFVRAVASLPGVASNDFSARFNVRGGRSDEVLVLLDGLELLKPFHLEDLESALSLVAPETLGSLQLTSGGLSAEFGDRMSGVLDMRTATAGAARTHYAGLALSDLALASSGRSRGGDRHWLVSARRGTLDLASEAVKAREEPRFWDVFGKVAREFSPTQALVLEFLRSRDRFHLGQQTRPGDETAASTYSNSYSWVTHEARPHPHWTLDSRLAFSHLEQDRRGSDSDLARPYRLHDRRILDVIEVSNRSQWSPTDDDLVKIGASWRRIEATYDYRLLGAERAATQSAAPSNRPRTLAATFHGRAFSGYASYRRRRGHLTTELGLRLDENEIVEDYHASPRLNLLWSPSSRGAFRLAVGRYHQSQRANELQVGDGETSFRRDESSTQFVLGYDVTLGARLQLRAEAYLRPIDQTRVRFENVLDPVTRVPEAELDRLAIDAEESASHGLELLLRGGSRRLDWWASYTYSRAEDRVDRRWIPRSFDQPHSIAANASSSVGDHWTVSASAEARSGWPTTPFEIAVIETPAGFRLEPSFGPLASARLGHYFRLDTRVARSWSTRRGQVQLWLSVLNTTNRGNPRGFEVSLPATATSASMPEVRGVDWLSRTASAGVHWRF